MVSVDWVTGEVTILKTDMILTQSIPQEVYDLDVDAFRLILIDLKDNPDGRPWSKTHNHSTQVTLSGIVYSRFIEFLPPYTFTFEDAQYAVTLSGGNNNIFDRKNFNQVSLLGNKSAGKQVTSASITETDLENIADKVWTWDLTPITSGAGKLMKFIKTLLYGK